MPVKVHLFNHCKSTAHYCYNKARLVTENRKYTELKFLCDKKVLKIEVLHTQGKGVIFLFRFDVEWNCVKLKAY